MVVELHLGQGSGSVVFGGWCVAPMVFWASVGCPWLISVGILGLSLGFLSIVGEKCYPELFSRVEGFAFVVRLRRCSKRFSRQAVGSALCTMFLTA